MPQYFFLKINGKSAKIFFDEVQYVEALDKYVKFVTEKKSYTVYGSLYHVEEWLPADQFCRIHRSYIISFRHIKEFTSDIVSIGETEFPIGKQYRNKFNEAVKVVSADGSANIAAPLEKLLATELIAKHTLIIFIVENFLTM